MNPDDPDNPDNPDNSKPYSLGPFEKDVLEESKRSNPAPDASYQVTEKKTPLSEQNFIQESRPFSPQLGALPLWLWMALGTMAIAIIWGGMGWYQNDRQSFIQSKPFLEVTNRDFSLFLWQFPDFMRSHAKQKTGYLPGFQYVNKETLDLSHADDFVIAPPEYLFIYHTWNRLLANDSIERPISAAEFQEFLEAVEEWQPKHWKQAPAPYAELIDSGRYRTISDLQSLSVDILPKVVRQAFQGWKNYFKEGPAINQITPTFTQVQEFLKAHPNYARNYWRNIQEINEKEVAGPHYLEALNRSVVNPEEKFPTDQLAPFLKVSLFNYLNKGKDAD